MRQLLYVSNTSPDLPNAELDRILATARRRNTAAGVTGMLLYMDGSFLQVLEGEGEAVDSIYADIHKDPRHWNIRTLLDQDVLRAFSEWSMGFARVTSGDTKDGMFRITSDAIAGRLNAGAPAELATLVRTFHRIQAGNNASLDAAE